MRVLHTSDWHVGKLLRGMSRIDEHRAVLTEIAEIAARDKVDLVLVAGDLFESMAPPPEAVAVAWDALVALRETAAQVVVVGGNHDHQPQLDAVAPLFARAGITMLGLPAGRERAVVDVAGARVVLVPWPPKPARRGPSSPWRWTRSRRSHSPRRQERRGRPSSSPRSRLGRHRCPCQGGRRVPRAEGELGAAFDP